MLRAITTLSTFIVVVSMLSGCGGGKPPQPSPPPTPPSVASVTITSLSPSSAVAGQPDLVVTIAGTGFDGAGVIQSRVVWTSQGISSTLDRTVVSSMQIVATIPAALLKNPTDAQIVVQHFDNIEGTVSRTSNQAIFSVTATPTPSVTPAADVLGIKGTRQFVVSGFDTDSAVNWSIEEGLSGGTITANGYYTAPSNTGTFHVVATSATDSSKNAAALVTVTAGGFVLSGAMHSARTGHTATLLNDGKVLIVGGDAAAELFDPATETFSITGSPATARLGATATLLSDGRVLIAGGLGLTAGSDGFLPLLNTAEIFDPATGVFSSTGTMVTARRGHTAVLLADGRVLIAGGYFDHICFTASAELFDPATETFSPTGFMLTEREGHTSTLLPSGAVLMAGGSNGCAPDAADDPPWDPRFAELYDPNSGSFKGASNMSTTRFRHAAVRLANGRVLMLGGIPPSLQNLHEQPPNPSYAELYDPAANSFIPLAGLVIAYERYTATLLSSGAVLIAGGEDASGEASTEAHLLDPNSGALSPAGAMNSARIGHTATLLGNGQVLVTGGTDAHGNSLATAELYK